MKHRHILLAFITLIIPPGFGWQAGEPDLSDLFHAIGIVESNNDDNATGDGGKAIGRYQIWHVYWFDATEFSGIGGRYHDCRKADYAETVMREYWKRYCREAYYAKDYERLSRVHNGGPKGHTKQATVKYWNKVKTELDRNNP